MGRAGVVAGRKAGAMKIVYTGAVVVVVQASSEGGMQEKHRSRGEYRRVQRQNTAGGRGEDTNNNAGERVAFAVLALINAPP